MQQQQDGIQLTNLVPDVLSEMKQSVIVTLPVLMYTPAP